MKRNKRILKRKEQGITLIALVITIIILLILAGVSIAMLTGENGILTQAKRAKEETERAQEEEENILNSYEDYLSQATNDGYVESKGVNAPVLKDGMELVTYNEETKNWETNNSSSAYDYVAGTGTDDNNSSRWANAKLTIDGVESYFVWIPRYAYKITYNNPEDISAGGTIDVKFLIGTTDQYYDEEGNLQTAKRATTGQEDTTSDYYVHPVFTSNVDLGGWSKELTGIWVGKYESSLVNKSDSSNIVTNDEETGNILLSENTDKVIAIQPGMSSWRYCTIGNMYTNARAYAENLNSHMLKNSEWGAVAYLTWSQYGRNGHEIDINDNSGFITADEGIEASKTQSSTGNIYGIYDLSGGGYEKVCAYIYVDSPNSSYNSSIINGEAFVDEHGKSTEFATAYPEETITSGYLGDATIETKAWNKDSNQFVTPKDVNVFFGRGGNYNDDDVAGIFMYYGNEGKTVNYNTFRICLTI